MGYMEILNSHQGLKKRRAYSEQKISALRESLFRELGNDLTVNVFAAGSLGRLEAGENSDLDVFVTSSEKYGRLKEIEIFSKIIRVNDELKFPSFSNDGEFLKIFPEDKDTLDKIGSPADDHENWFTTRMLFMLESQPALTEIAWEAHLKLIIDVYYRDAKDHAGVFVPVFLLNDILRYWRTVCLNYEVTRHTPNRPWTKKNINLKYSRRLTVYSTALYLAVCIPKDADEVVSFFKLPPLERLAVVMDKMKLESSFEDRFKKFLDDYTFFLDCKSNGGECLEKNHDSLESGATEFSKIVYELILSGSVNDVMRRVLVV